MELSVLGAIVKRFSSKPDHVVIELQQALDHVNTATIEKGDRKYQQFELHHCLVYWQVDPA